MHTANGNSVGVDQRLAQIGEATSPMVSVIIVNWNARDYLAKCLDTLTPAACAYPMEIIVVDNASSHGSPDEVEQRYPHVRLVRSGGNLGFAKGNNLGIAHSKGLYRGSFIG